MALALSEIPTLASLYKLGKIAAAASSSYTPNASYNKKISVIQNDITKLDVDAIVNAANQSLLGGGGVDGAIHRGAGKELVEECRKLNGCATGSAKITNGYKLPAKKVIHAVGPVYSSRKSSEPLLRGCYRTSLDLAVDNGCKSLAFSALSTGVYGYPSNEAAEAVIDEVRKWLDEDSKRAEKLDRIIFCNFGEKDQKPYYEFLP